MAQRFANKKKKKKNKEKNHTLEWTFISSCLDIFLQYETKRYTLKVSVQLSVQSLSLTLFSKFCSCSKTLVYMYTEKIYHYTSIGALEPKHLPIIIIISNEIERQCQFSRVQSIQKSKYNTHKILRCILRYLLKTAGKFIWS